MRWYQGHRIDGCLSLGLFWHIKLGMSPVIKLTVSQAFTGGEWATKAFAKALCLPVCIDEELLAEPHAPINHHVVMVYAA